MVKLKFPGIQSAQIGEVAVKPFKPGRAQLVFYFMGERHRPIIPAMNQQDAEFAAHQVASALANLRMNIQTVNPLAVVQRLQGTQIIKLGPMIDEAIEQSIDRGSNAQLRTKTEMRYAMNLFIAWLEIAHPKIAVSNLWEQVTYGVVQEYANSISHLSRARIKHRLVPLSLASRYWLREAPSRFHDIMAGIRIPDGSKTPEIHTLDAVKLKWFLTTMSDLSPSLYPIIALSSFTGLRIYEAAFLRHCDVDLKAKIITVEKTSLHTPKTLASYRTLPLSRKAFDLLSKHLKLHQAMDESETIFTTAKGLVWNKESLGSAWRRFTTAAQEQDAERLRKNRKDNHPTIPAGYSMRGSRRTFATLAEEAGANRDHLKCYLGQTPTDILGKHYVKVNLAKLQKVADALDTAISDNNLTTVDTIAQ